MANLHFIYSTMNSGKSLDLLKTAHNYESQGKKVVLFTSEKDTRVGEISPTALKSRIETRLGLTKEAWLIERVNAFAIVESELPNCVLVDEVQFMQETHVRTLAKIVDELDIPVLAYGLKNTYQGNLFEGSKAMLFWADKIKEMKAVCVYCDKKATMNMLLDDNNEPVFRGDTDIIIGYSFLPVCRRCYMRQYYLSEEKNKTNQTANAG